MGYIPVRTSTLRPGVALKFDVFVNFKERYIQYKRSADLFEEERLNRFLKKGVKKIFILEEQESSYLEYLEAALDQLQESSISIEERSTFARETLTSEAENVEKNLDSEEGYNKTTNRIDKVIDFLGNETSALKNMLASAGVAVDNSAHCANVASLALALAQKIPITDKDDIQSLGLAALLHDMGKSKVGIDPAIHRDNLPREKMSAYRKHPEAAVEMLSGKKYITPKVLRLILEHHELGEGEGFPEKKWIKKLPPNSQVLNLCNEFDRFSMLKNLPAAEVLPEFVQTKGKLFMPKHIELLDGLLGS